jgi:hypothetical protein
MLKKSVGFGFLLLLLSLPLQADHKHHRSRRHPGRSFAPGYVEVHVGTPYGHGMFVRGLRAAPRYGRPHFYSDTGRTFRKYKRRHYFKKHRHYHYDSFCPY